MGGHDGSAYDLEAVPYVPLPSESAQSFGSGKLREEVPGKVGESSTTRLLSYGSSRMQEAEKVALAGLAALLVVMALVELMLAAPLVWRAALDSGSEAQAQGANASEPYPRFLVLGDWGREGQYNQTLVADAMSVKAARMGGIDFVISTGDNFYESGIISPQDPQFNTSFIDVYHQPSLQVPWHAVLGNHDYGETDSKHLKTPKIADCGGSRRGECFYGPLHQLDVRLTQRDPRWHCERSYTLSLAGGRVDVFFIDTTPIIDKYYQDAWAGNRGGLLEQSWRDQVFELEARLARSRARWKLVVGHHPIRAGHTEELGWSEMQARVEPLLLQYGVDAYFCGHDHNLQYIYSPELKYHHVISGAGSKVYKDVSDFTHSLFGYGGNGFVAVVMTADSMRIEFIGLDSEEPLYAVDIPRNGTNGR